MRQTALLAIVSAFALPAGVFGANVEMPAWGDAADSASYRLGGGLWPTDILGPVSEGDASSDASDIASVEVAEPDPKTFVGPPKLVFYGPNGEMPKDPITAPVVAANSTPSEFPDSALKFPDTEAIAPPVEELPPLEGKLADVYFEHPPVDFLIDPQRLLTEQKSNDIKRFLEFHSDESEFHLYVMVFGENQKIPEEVDLQSLHQQWFSDRPAVVLLYFRERPELTEFLYSDKVRSALPSSVFERIAQNTLREGGATDLAPDQVEKMAIELSIQLYWLSRLLRSEGSESHERAVSGSVHDLPASADAPELLREYAPGIFLEEKGRKVLSIVVTALLIIGSVLAVAGLGWLAMWFRNRQRIAGNPLIFPSFEILPRLGGEFCGGAFVSMSFEINEGSDFSA